jgi:GNAT superfamily N-acetyltransferase
VIHYRTFRNPDPPLLVEVWNASLTGRRTIRIQTTTLLEYFTLAKPWFDPEGLIFALDGDKAIGVAHAGFAGDAAGTAVDTSIGVLSLLTVLPDYRRQGVGSELLRRAEAYLTRRGARELLAGGMAPRNPYLFGMYGGCDSPGILATEPGARPFFEKYGYQIAQTCGIFQRELERMYLPADPRFQAIRQRYDIIATPYSQAGWWREGVLGPIEAVEYRLQDKQSEQISARAIMWDMETFAQEWHQACVGLIDLHVEPPFRRQGLAKYLLAQVLRHLRQQPFQIFEAQAALDNEPMLRMLRGLEFQQVETGNCFRRS